MKSIFKTLIGLIILCSTLFGQSSPVLTGYTLNNDLGIGTLTFGNGTAKGNITLTNGTLTIGAGGSLVGAQATNSNLTILSGNIPTTEGLLLLNTVTSLGANMTLTAGVLNSIGGGGGGGNVTTTGAYLLNIATPANTNLIVTENGTIADVSMLAANLTPYAKTANLTWGNSSSGHPTTMAGYGITDGNIGTVTSVSGSGGTTGLTLTGGPITGSGTLTIGGNYVYGNLSGIPPEMTYLVSNPAVISVLGTSNQITVSPSGNVTTLSIPSSPIFGGNASSSGTLNSADNSGNFATTAFVRSYTAPIAAYDGGTAYSFNGTPVNVDGTGNATLTVNGPVVIHGDRANSLFTNSAGSNVAGVLTSNNSLGTSAFWYGVYNGTAAPVELGAYGMAPAGVSSYLTGWMFATGSSPISHTSQPTTGYIYPTGAPTGFAVGLEGYGRSFGQTAHFFDTRILTVGSATTADYNGTPTGSIMGVSIFSPVTDGTNTAYTTVINFPTSPYDQANRDDTDTIDQYPLDDGSTNNVFGYKLKGGGGQNNDDMFLEEWQPNNGAWRNGGPTSIVLEARNVADLVLIGRGASYSNLGNVTIRTDGDGQDGSLDRLKADAYGRIIIQHSGTFTLSSGTVTVTDALITTTSTVITTCKTVSGTPGTYEPRVTLGTGNFTVNGLATDNSTYTFTVFN